MANWLDDAFTERKKKEAKAKAQQEQAARRRDMFKFKAEDLWSELVKIIKRDVSQINTHFKEEGRSDRWIEFEDISQFEIQLDKVEFPAHYVNLKLRLHDEHVLIRRKVRTPVHNSLKVNSSVSSPIMVNLEFDAQDELHFAMDGRIVSSDDISELIIRPMIIDK